MPKDTVRSLGLALIPDQIGIEYICRLNSRINEQYPSEFILRPTDNLLPHISLFQGNFPESVLGEVLTRLNEISLKKAEIRPVAPTGINLWATKIFFLDLRNDLYSWLPRWHWYVFNALNNWRDHSSGSADPQTFVGISDQERDSYNKYGYPFALKAFRPHFTIGRSELNDGQEQSFCEQLAKELPPPAQINFVRPALFQVGQFGRLERIMADFG